VVEAFRDEQVSDDGDEVASYERAFGSFEGAAIFGGEVRELLLRVMKEFRELADTVTP
jgi:hypothetical protein